MKMLLYLQSACSYNNDFPLYFLWEFMIKPFGCLKDDFEIKLMAPEKLFIQYEKILRLSNEERQNFTAANLGDCVVFFKDMEKIPISKAEIHNCFEGMITDWEMYLKDLNKEITSNEENRIKELFVKKLNGWIPDVIITFPNHLYILNTIFNKSLVFTTENSVFSRTPFPWTKIIDSVGSLEINFMIKFKEEIKQFQITKEQNEKVEFLKSYIVNRLKEHFDVEKIIQPYRVKFRKLILVPLIGIYRGGKLSYFNEDVQVIDFVMSKVAPDVGVIFTGHPNSVAFQQASIWYYESKYHNFIFLPELCKYPMQSPPLFPYIDAIVNPYSETGNMALFWDIPIVPLCGHYNDWFKDCDSIDQLEEVFKQKRKNKNNLLFWYLTHYVCFPIYFENPSFLKNYFNNKLVKFREHGITFDFYEQNEDFEKISNYIIETIQNNIEHGNPIKKGAYIFGKLKIFDIIRYKKDIYVYFLKIKMLHISFLQKKLFLFGIPIMRWNNK